MVDTFDDHPTRGVLKLAPGASAPTLLPFTDGADKRVLRSIRG